MPSFAREGGKRYSGLGERPGRAASLLSPSTTTLACDGLMDWTTAIVLTGAAAAGLAQGVSGFAFSLVALSIWVWAIPPQLAGPMAVFGSLAGQIVTLPWVWRGFELRLLLPFVAGGLLGVPLGILLLHWLDPDLFKLMLGVFLLVYCPLALTLPHDFKLHAGGRFADGIAGFVGGVMGGLSGASGPNPTLWTTLRGLAKETQRGVLQAFNISMHTATLTGYSLTGTIDEATLVMFVLIAPALAIPAVIGVQIFRRMPTPAFRRLVLIFLFMSGLVLCAGSVGPFVRSL